MSSGPGSLSRHLHLSEFNFPLPTAGGQLSPDDRRARARQNMGLALSLATGGAERVSQVAPDTVSVTGTLTTANMLKGLLLTNPAAAQTLTTATGTALDAAITDPPLSVDQGFDLVVANLSANALTWAVGAGVTNGGSAEDLTIAANVSATYRFRKTATNAFTMYRIA